MKKKIFFLAFCAMLLALCSPVEAQRATKVFRIGFLDPGTASGSAVLLDAFRQELSKLGWIEGKNITIDYRFAEQKPERVPELAADLVRLKVDLIVVSGGPTASAAKKATATVPIVMVNAGDPVGWRYLRCSPQARRSWASADVGNQHRKRSPTEKISELGLWRSSSNWKR